MIIKTYQHPIVLETLLKGEAYIALFDNTPYKDRYKCLSNMLYSNSTICPIFGYCDNITKHITTYGAKHDADNGGVLLTLDVPKEECNLMEYYEWTNFMYFNELYANKNDYKIICDNEEISQKQYDELIDRIITGWTGCDESTFNYNQTVMQCIKPEWLVEYEINKPPLGYNNYKTRKI